MGKLVYTFVMLCFGLCIASPDAAALTLREGRHQGFQRLVFESSKPGSVMLSKDLRDASLLDLTFKGGVCAEFKDHRKVISKVIESWSVTSLPHNHCRVSLNLRHKNTVKRAFTLQNKKGSAARFVVDLSPIKAAPLSVDLTPKALTMASWQSEPSEKPAYMAGNFLGKGKWFAPTLLRKPFRPTIVIDPGHGGHDPGSVSCRGHYEKHVTLQAAKVMAEELKKSGYYHVHLTRTRDGFVSKRERFAKAREVRAHFLISIHGDNHPSKKLRGLTLYTLSPKASDAEAARLSKQENRSDFLGELDFAANITKDVSNVLINIAQRSAKNTALHLAETFHGCLLEDKVGKILTLRSADLAVLKAPDTPSILVELGYLSNEKDERLVRTMAYQKKVAKSLLRALNIYFEKS